MSAKWRLLEIGEIQQNGDEYWPDDQGWLPVGRADIGAPHQDVDIPCRRRMTHAEEHAEELLMHLKEMHDWFEEGRRHHFSIGSIGDAISKAEGRGAP